MSEKRFTIEKIFKEYPKLRDNETECFYHLVDNERNAEIFCERLNNLVEENEQLKNELRKEKSLREYSDSMYGADLIVNIRFSNGEWKADVSVIDDE